MPHVDIVNQYTIKCSARDFLLICKALGGRLKDDEIEDARALGDDLTKQKAGSIKNMAISNEKLLRNLEQGLAD
jgi:hypothetical protein